jgi:ABC-type transport system substrate-binding protein
MVALRTDVPPFKDDINLRKAVVHAVNGEEICRDILGGLAIQVGSVNGPDVFGYNKEVKPHKYDPELAKSYLKQSKYRGEEIGLVSTTGRYLKDIEINTAIVGYLKAVGIHTKLTFLDWPTWMERIRIKKQEPICWRGWSEFTGDGAQNLYVVCHSKSPNSWFDERGVAGLDELVDLANSSFNQETRRKAIEKANVLVNQYYGFAINYVPVKVYAMQKNVKWAPRLDEATQVLVKDDK